MFEIPIPIIGRKGGAKDIIISVLSEEWPLGTKKIHNKILKQHSMPITYQAVHKALKELTEMKVILFQDKKYRLNLKWLQEIERFSTILQEKYLESKKEKRKIRKIFGTIRVYDSLDDFYKIVIPMFSTEKILRITSKTSGFILTREAELNPWRKKYFETFLNAIKDKKPKIKYLISTELTKKYIIQDRDLDAIKRLEKYSNTDALKIRHVPVTSIVSGALGKRDYLIGYTAPEHTDVVGVLHIRSKNLEPLNKLFDAIFSNAFETKDLIEEVKKELRIE